MANHRKHGLTGTSLYKVWTGMKYRCFTRSCRAWPDYGGRGIGVCPEWASDFSAFMQWAEQTGYKKGLTLDRVDNNGHYCPDNCRWATRREQVMNRRPFKLVKLSEDDIPAIIADTRLHRIIAAEYGVDKSLVGRIKRGLHPRRHTRNLERTGL